MLELKCKSKRLRSLLKQIDNVLSDVETYDFRGQPVDDNDIGEFVTKLKEIKIENPENNGVYTIFGTDVATALVNSELWAKYGNE
jgi:hypothetical protein